MRSVNQNHHLYVATAMAQPTNDSNVGTIYPYVYGEGPDKELYFKYKGHDGVVRSDFIPVNQISYLRVIPAEKQVTKLKAVDVILDDSMLVEDENHEKHLIVGQDYVLNIEFRQFYGLSPEDTYVKTVAVHVTKKNDTPQKFFESLVDELNASFSREIGASANENPYLEFSVNDSFTDPNDDESTVYALNIVEKEQAWTLGKWEVENLMFNVFPSTITVDGVEAEWGITFTDPDNDSVSNSKKMADLEWFTFSERADFYHGMGYPNNFDFKPIVEPDYANGYDALEIHFAYQGSCEDIQKSEKDITIIGKSNGNNGVIPTLYTQLQTLHVVGK